MKYFSFAVTSVGKFSLVTCSTAFLRKSAVLILDSSAAAFFAFAARFLLFSKRYIVSYLIRDFYI
jgi:hypothetical protein